MVGREKDGETGRGGNQLTVIKTYVLLTGLRLYHGIMKLSASQWEITAFSDADQFWHSVHCSHLTYSLNLPGARNWVNLKRGGEGQEYF